jgi:hypothetical protein
MATRMIFGKSTALSDQGEVSLPRVSQRPARSQSKLAGFCYARRQVAVGSLTAVQ